MLFKTFEKLYLRLVADCVQCLLAIVDREGSGQAVLLSTAVAQLYDTNASYAELCKCVSSPQGFVRRYGAEHLCLLRDADSTLYLARRTLNPDGTLLVKPPLRPEREVRRVTFCDHVTDIDGHKEDTSPRGAAVPDSPLSGDESKAGGASNAAHALVQGAVAAPGPCHQPTTGAAGNAETKVPAGNDSASKGAEKHIATDIQSCVSTLRAIVGRTTGRRLHVGLLGTTLYEHMPHCRDLISSEGGLRAFLSKHAPTLSLAADHMVQCVGEGGEEEEEEEDEEED